MSFTWTRDFTNRASDYRPARLPVPVNTDRDAMNRTYAVRRWVRGHAAPIWNGALGIGWTVLVLWVVL